MELVNLSIDIAAKQRRHLLEKDMCGFETAEGRKTIQCIMEEQYGG